MMSARRRQRCHSLSDDSEEAHGNHTNPGPEPEPEELAWDSYSTTLEHRLAAVGNSCWFVMTVCVVDLSMNVCQVEIMNSLVKIV